MWFNGRYFIYLFLIFCIILSQAQYVNLELNPPRYTRKAHSEALGVEADRPKGWVNLL
jgi:hypothetical protein